MKEEKKNVPKLRFPEFTDGWEQRKFSDCYKMSSGFAFKMSDYCEDGVGLINGESIQHGIINDDNLNYLPESFIKEYSDFILKEGDIVVGLNRPITNGNLKIARIPSKYNDSLLYQRAGKIVYKEECDKDFSYVLLSQEILKHTLVEAVGSDQPFISTSKLDKWQMMMPKDVEEQYKIGKYFTVFDNLITLHQRKLDQIKEYKNGMLQKMFPKEGETVPEVRFPEFEGEWEQRKLGDIADIVGGGTPSTSVVEYWDGDIEWYAPAEISDQIFVKTSQRKITQEGYDNSSARILPVGTVLFTSRAGIGKTAILSQEGCTNQGFQSIVPHKDELDSYFIYSRTPELKKYGETVGAGSTFVEVSGKQMAAMALLMPPTLDEQVKIGGFFQMIDKTITLHQRKLEAMKEYKKGLLQQMFV